MIKSCHLPRQLFLKKTPDRMFAAKRREPKILAKVKHLSGASEASWFTFGFIHFVGNNCARFGKVSAVSTHFSDCNQPIAEAPIALTAHF